MRRRLIPDYDEEGYAIMNTSNVWDPCLAAVRLSVVGPCNLQPVTAGHSVRILYPAQDASRQQATSSERT